MTDWQDYDEWWMGKTTGSNNVFHSGPDCPAFKSDCAKQRSENYMAYHEPSPCERCHADIEKNQAQASCMKVLGQLGVDIR